MKSIKTPLLIAPSEKIEGLLSLEKANQYKIGIISSISFKTFCKLNNSKHDDRFVILAKTNNWINPYIEPFTGLYIKETDKRIIRGATYNSDLMYTGNDSTIKKLKMDKLGQIFPEDASIEEYKRLLYLFAEQNKLALQEIKKIQENQKSYEESLDIITQTPKDSERGKQIFEMLNNHNNEINLLYYDLLTSLNEEAEPSKVLEYTIK